MKRLSLVGIIVGGITDIVSTNVLMIPVIIYILATNGIPHLPKAQQPIAAVAALRGNVFLYVITYLIGGFCSILGGYVAAWIAKRDYILNGVLSSFLCIGSEFFFKVSGPSEFDEPLWLEMLFLPVSPLLGALGGYLRALGRGGIAKST